MAMDGRELERAERARTTRMKAGFFWLGMGLMALATAVLNGADGWLARQGADGWFMGAGGAAVVIGAVMAWVNRPGSAARRLERAPGARDRAQRERSHMLNVIPASMLIFGGLSVKAMGEVQAGPGEFGDWAMIAVAMLYAWMGPLFVMGWDGAALRNRRLLEDELTRHHRARSVTPAFILLLVLMTGLCGLGLWRADLAIRFMPLALCVAGAAAALRFARLERQAEGED